MFLEDPLRQKDLLFCLGSSLFYPVKLVPKQVLNIVLTYCSHTLNVYHGLNDIYNSIASSDYEAKIKQSVHSFAARFLAVAEISMIGFKCQKTE